VSSRWGKAVGKADNGEEKVLVEERGASKLRGTKTFIVAQNRRELIWGCGYVRHCRNWVRDKVMGQYGV